MIDLTLIGCGDANRSSCRRFVRIGQYWCLSFGYCHVRYDLFGNVVAAYSVRGSNFSRWDFVMGDAALDDLSDVDGDFLDALSDAGGDSGSEGGDGGGGSDAGLSIFSDAAADADLDGLSGNEGNDVGEDEEEDFLDMLSEADAHQSPERSDDDEGRSQCRPASDILTANAVFFARADARTSAGGIELIESSEEETLTPAQARAAHARSRCRRRAAPAADDRGPEASSEKPDLASIISSWGDRAMAVWQSVPTSAQMTLSVLTREVPSKHGQEEYYDDIEAICTSHVQTRKKGPRIFSGLRTEMEATRVGCSVPVYKARKNEVAEISFLASRLFLAAVFRTMVETKTLMPTRFFIELVHFVVYGDETPAKFRVREVQETSEVGIIVAKDGTGPLAASARFERSASVQTAKVVQGEMRVRILTRSVDETGKDHYAHYTTELPVPLGSFDHNTADNLHAWYTNLLDIPGFSQEVLDTSVERVAATTVMDLAASNGRMINWARHLEKNLDGKGWRRLQFCCQVHRVQTCQGHVYDIVSLHISAMIALALSLTHTGTFGKLKRALGWIMTVALEWHGPEEQPPDAQDECTLQRQALLDACIPDLAGDSKDDDACAVREKRRATYNILFNGDVSIVGRVQHFCRPGCCKNKRDTERKLRGHGVWCLLPHAPGVFPVHRWTGSDVVVQFLTLLANTHGLLMMVVPLWTKLAKAKNDYRTSESVKKFVEEELPQLVTDSDDDSALSVGQEPDQPKRAWGGRRRGGKAKQTRDDVATDWASRNKRHRAEVKSWARLHPDIPLCVMLRCIQPGASLMYSLLKRAGVKWDVGVGAECLKSGRMVYRILEEHFGNVFQKYVSQMLSLFIDELSWALIKVARMAMESRALAFRLLARSLATVWLLVVWPCLGYPHKLFSILGDDPVHAATYILADPNCLYDDFTSDFVSEFNTVELLSGLLARQLLLAIISDIRDEISRIESRNAQISHAARLKSGHTWTAEVPDMGAGFFLQRVRAIFGEHHLATGGVHLEERKKSGPRPMMKRPASAPPGPKRQKGPWRAFMTEASENKTVASEGFGSAFAKSASSAYRALPDGERERLRLIAAAAPREEPTGAAAAAPQNEDAASDPLEAAVRAFLEEPLPADAGGGANDVPAVFDIVPRNFDLDSVQLQIARISKAATATRRLDYEAASDQLSSFAVSEAASATLSVPQRGLGAFYGKPVDKSFERTSIFEIIPPLGDFVGSVMQRAGHPRFDKNLYDVFGHGSFHEVLRESWARRHGTWKHAERTALPTTVPKSPGNASICRAYGWCICHDEDLKLFLQKITALLKSLCAKDSKWAACVDCGGCVLEFRVVDSGWDVKERRRFHISYVNHNSWAVGLLELHRSTDRVCLDTASVFNNEAVRFAPESHVVGDPELFMAMGVGNTPLLLSDLDFAMRIQLRLHELVGGRRLAPVKKPAEQEIKWIGSEIEFWLGSTREKAAIAAPAPGAAPVAAPPGPAPPADAAPVVAAPITDGDPHVEEVAADWAVALEAQLAIFAEETAFIVYQWLVYVLLGINCGSSVFKRMQYAHSTAEGANRLRVPWPFRVRTCMLPPLVG